MIEGPTDETSLKGLADAIKLLYDTEAREWTADDVISLVDELSGVALPLSLIHRIIRSCPPKLGIKPCNIAYSACSTGKVITLGSQAVAGEKINL